jgi:mono/diheme cytochrome c family protein/glucose/arabinose dehydrogenase
MNLKPRRFKAYFFESLSGLALAIIIAGMSLTAQSPGAPPQSPVPAGGAPPAAGGQGAGAGRGAQVDPTLPVPDFTKQPSIVAKRPEEELKQFIMQPGYRMELVLADPDIKDPTSIMFDGNGRMFVLENPGYMINKDAIGELDPIGRISLWTDSDNDGVYDKHTIFVDHLVFPRFVTPYGPNTILTKESNAQEVWKFTDTNGDGVADKKELFGTDYGRTSNVEHQESGMLWALDNWLYTTFNLFRSRSTPNGVVKETVGSGQGAEWGLTQDSEGKIWYLEGSNGVPAYWQFPIVYGNINIPEPGAGLDPDARIPWGAPILLADMQEGMRSVRWPDGSSKNTSAGSGGVIVRGDRLPKDLLDKYCYGEPIARMIRCMYQEKKEGLTYLHTMTPQNEFIKSLDPLFRPVDIKTAPDGTLYVTDMYHGIVQEVLFAGPGSYLRQRIEQYDLDKIVHYGRIWRLVYDGVKPDRSDAVRRDRIMPRMNNETAAQLVTHLTHPNGWWRDTAQQLLVLKGDKSVVPALQTMAKTSPNLLGRFHAMWTLEGLGALDLALARQLMKDPEPRMRIQAIRASETLYKAGDLSLASDYQALTKDPSIDVVIQSMLTMSRWKVPDAATTIQTTMDSHKATRGIQVVGTTVLNAAANAGRGGGRGGAPLSPEQQNALAKGGEIYNELCISCHGMDGMGTPTAERDTTKAPPLSGSPRVNGHRDYVIKAVLHGLIGPVDGRNYTNVMIPMGANDDQWVANVTSFVRRSFGNTGGFVTPADVARVRSATTARQAPFSVEEIRATLPVLLVNDGWKATASHNSDAAPRALSLTSWNTGVPQQAGMWFQIELPRAASLTEIQFDSTAGTLQLVGGMVVDPNAPARGGGGPARGAAGAAPATPPPPPPPVGYPRSFKAEVSADGTSWQTVATGAGTGPTTVIAFPAVTARFVKITTTESPQDSPSWSIQGLKLYEAGKGR